MANREDAIVALAKEKSQKRQNEIMLIIATMYRSGEKISFYSVAQKSHASKSYLYRNETIASEIRSHRQKNSEKKTSDSKDVIIKALQSKIKKLENENEQLKKQLEIAYKY